MQGNPRTQTYHAHQLPHRITRLRPNTKPVLRACPVQRNLLVWTGTRILAVKIRRPLRDGVVSADDLQGLCAAGRPIITSARALSPSSHKIIWMGWNPSTEGLELCNCALDAYPRTEPARQQYCRKDCVCCRNAPTEFEGPSCRCDRVSCDRIGQSSRLGQGRPKLRKSERRFRRSGFSGIPEYGIASVGDDAMAWMEFIVRCFHLDIISLP